MSSGASAAFSTQPTTIQSSVTPDASAATVPTPVVPTTVAVVPAADASAAAAPTVSSYVAPDASAAVAPTVSSYVAPSASAAAAPTVSSYVAPSASAAAAPTVSSYVAPTASAAVAPTVSSYVAPTASAAAAPTVSSYVAPTASAAAAPDASAAFTPTIVPSYITPTASAAFDPSGPMMPAYVDPLTSGAYTMPSQTYLASGAQYNVTSPGYIMSANQSASSPTFVITPSGPNINSIKSGVMSLTDRIKSDIASLNAAQASGAFGINSVDNIKSSVIRSANRIQGNLRGNNSSRTMRQYEREFNEKRRRNLSGPAKKDRGLILGTYIAAGLDYTNGSLGNRKSWQTQLGVSYNDANNNDTTAAFADINRLVANGVSVVLSFIDKEADIEEFSFECSDSCTYDAQNKGTKYALFNIDKVVTSPAKKNPTLDNEYEIYATVDGKPYRGKRLLRNPTKKVRGRNVITTSPSSRAPARRAPAPAPARRAPVPVPTPAFDFGTEEAVNDGSGTQNNGSETQFNGTGTQNNGSDMQFNGTGTQNNNTGTQDNGSGTQDNGSGMQFNGTGTENNDSMQAPVEENTFQGGGQYHRVRRNGRHTKKKGLQPKKRSTRRSR
jgi:hypothetical protein